MTTSLRTPRLQLRRWQDTDIQDFAKLNADPIVMEYFPNTLTLNDTTTMVERIEAGFEQYGFGLWAVVLSSDNTFIGFTGLSVPSFQAPFTPCVEIGWRLSKAHWGQGYATEAAKAALDYGFRVAGLSEVVSFTAVPNLRSRRVMERLGMKPMGTFEHPKISEGHWLRPHVWYQIKDSPLVTFSE